MNALELAIVMPVYNEEASVARVLEEWLPEVKKLNISFRFFVLDDGSKDRTLAIVQNLKSRHSPYIEVLTHSNRGHGQTCVAGYKAAIAAQAQWILQIDSDGQCDPQYLSKFWEARNASPVIFGYRKKRDDGYIRFLISRVVALTGWIGSGVWVKDPNVPYRLMKASTLADCVNIIPQDFYLANILLSIILKKRFQIQWIPIHFRERFGGSPSVKLRSFAKHGTHLVRHLWRVRSQI